MAEPMCFGCPAEYFAEQIESASPESQPISAVKAAEIFSQAFSSAREAISENPDIGHRDLDREMGSLNPAQQEPQKVFGDLDLGQIAAMAKNCAVAKRKGRCMHDIIAARAQRVKNRPQSEKS